MNRFVRCWGVVAVLLLRLCPAGWCDVVSIAPSRDGTLYQSAGGGVANGAGQHLFIGRVSFFQPPSTVVRRTVLYFDVASAVPAGVTVTSAVLRLNLSKTSSGAQPAVLRRVSRAWGEGASDAPLEEGGGTAAAPGDATWMHTFYPTSFWTTAGGDFSAVPSASNTVLVSGFHAWSGPQMVADVQVWLDRPATNFGWILIGNEAIVATSKRFDSHENLNPGVRPELQVGFRADVTPFVDNLPVPSVLQPVTGQVGEAAQYVIALREVEHQFHRDIPPSRVWGYEGQVPGPTIEAGSGKPLVVLWTNDLRDTLGNLRTNHYLAVDLRLHGPDMLGGAPRTVVHLHGGHTPASSDGYPEDTILPGQSATYVYPNLQHPATLWYHDHALGITRLNMYMGLAGVYIVRDAEEAALGLPAGEFEAPLAVCDRTFNPDGSLYYPATWVEHFFGDRIVVNGKVWPYFQVKRGKYRFRVLNACNSRTLRLFLSDGAAFHQIGVDGGLLPAPVVLTNVTLTVGERADLVLDFAAYAPGTEILLLNSAPAPYPGTPGVGVVTNVMKFIVQAGIGQTNALPALLRPIDRLLETNAVQTRQFVLAKAADPHTGQAWLINGLHWDDITEFPVLDTTEIWSFVNRSGTVHPMHVHLSPFLVLDRQPFQWVEDAPVPSGPRVPPPPEEAGWKDTVRADPLFITRVIVRFEDYLGLFPYHCHIVEHEDNDMMRQFLLLPRPELTGLRMDGNDFVVRFSTTSNRLHAVQSITNLQSSDWTDWVTNLPGDGSEVSATNVGGAFPARAFHRIRLQP